MRKLNLKNLLIFVFINLFFLNSHSVSAENNSDKAKEFLEKQFWITQGFSNLKADKWDGQSLQINQPTISFTVEEYMPAKSEKYIFHDTLRVKLSTGEMAQISFDVFTSKLFECSEDNLLEFKTIKQNYIYDKEPSLKEEDCRLEVLALQKEKQKIEQNKIERKKIEKQKKREAKIAEISKTRDANLNVLKEKQITAGSTLWIQQPIDIKQADKWVKGTVLARIKILSVDQDINPDSIISPLGLITITAEIDGKKGVIVFEKIDDAIKPFTTQNLERKAKKWGTRIVKAIKAGKVFIGMTNEQVLYSWGEPEQINRTVGVWGIHEQWVYGGRTFLYFENNKLTSFQD